MTSVRGDVTVPASLSRCFRRGSADVQEKDVEGFIRHGRYVVAMRTRETVCDRCGERYFDQETVQLFEATRKNYDRLSVGDAKNSGSDAVRSK
jgi:hypothetical protein